MISGFLERLMSVVAMAQLQLNLRQQLVAERKKEKLMAVPQKLGDQVNLLTGVAAQALLTEKSADK